MREERESTRLAPQTFQPTPTTAPVDIHAYAVETEYGSYNQSGVLQSAQAAAAQDTSSSSSSVYSAYTDTDVYYYFTDSGVVQSVHVQFATSDSAASTGPTTDPAVSASATAPPPASTAQDVDGGGGGGSGPSPSRMPVILGVSISVGVLLLSILGVYLVIRRRRAKHGAPPPSEKPRRRGVSASPIDTTAMGSSAAGSASSSARGGGGYEGIRLSRADAFDIVPLPPLPVRYSRVPPLPLPPRRIPSRASEHTSWADDSEYDALATDGSSSARTLSTYSDVSQDTLRGGLGQGEQNPFDHPAYTHLSSRRDVMGTGSVGTYHTSGSPSHDPFSDPTSPMESTRLQSPSTTVPPAAFSRNGTLQIEDDLLLSDPLSTGATIIQHIDGGRHLAPERARLPRETRTGQGEVHIPPTYNTLFP